MHLVGQTVTTHLVLGQIVYVFIVFFNGVGEPHKPEEIDDFHLQRFSLAIVSCWSTNNCVASAANFFSGSWDIKEKLQPTQRKEI